MITTKIIWMISGVAGFLIIVMLISSMLTSFKLRSNKIEGSKRFVSSRIVEFAKDCYNRNYPRKINKICYTFEVRSDEDIDRKNIEQLLAKDGISARVDSLNKECKIIIEYAAGTIIIESENYERISD